MKPCRVIIAGSRDCPEHCDKLLGRISDILSNLTPENTEIVSGTARGADRLGENFAKINSYDLKLFPANWNSLGKKAGMIRNKQMAEYSSHLIALWDGKSKGTAHMINLAKEEGLEIRIINI